MVRSPWRALVVVIFLCASQNGSGAQGRIEAVTRPDGSVGLRLDGRDAQMAGAQGVAFAAPWARRGRVTARRIEMDGRSVVEVKAAETGGARAEVWLGLLDGVLVRPLLVQTTGAQDADGETFLDLEITRAGIARHQRAARIGRCDGEPARLFRQTWDFSRAAWVDAPPALPPGRAADVVHAVPHAAGGGSAVPHVAGVSRARTFAFSAASVSPRAASARDLAAPYALDDGDAGTVWEATPPLGAWVTARASGDPVVEGVAIVLGSPAPKRLALLFGAPDAGRVDVELSPAGRVGAPWWVPLPRPRRTSCVSVMITGVEEGATRTALADLHVVTALDGADGPKAAVAAVAASSACDGRVVAAASFGRAAIEPLLAAIAAPRTAGRSCLIETLSRIAVTETALPGLAAAMDVMLADATPDEDAAWLGLVRRFDEAAMAPLVAAFSDESRSVDVRVRAARWLASGASQAGRSALLAAVGRPPAEVRAAARRGASVGVPSDQILQALGETPAADAARRGDLLHVLGAQADRDATVRDAVAAAAALAVTPAQPFEVRARGVEVLGRLGGAAATSLLGDLRGGDEDPVIRWLAVSALARDASAPLPALRGALDDGDPRVRETAALALGRRLDRVAAPLLVAGAKQEPWPFVRRAEIVALGDLCTEAGNALLVRANERDRADIRRPALAGLARCRDARAPAVLEAVLDSGAEPIELRILAAGLLGGFGPSAGPALSRAVQTAQEEAQGDPVHESLVVAALRALAASRAAEAEPAALRLASDPRPALRRAAIEALGTRCSAAAAAAIDRARRDGHEGVATAARGAGRRCGGAAK